jgi:hypothetical protein
MVNGGRCLEMVLQQQSEEGHERCTKTNGGRRPGCSTHRGCRGGCGFRLQNWRGGVLWQREVDNGLRLELEGDGNSLPSMLRKGGKGRKNGWGTGLAVKREVRGGSGQGGRPMRGVAEGGEGFPAATKTRRARAVHDVSRGRMGR